MKSEVFEKVKSLVDEITRINQSIKIAEMMISDGFQVNNARVYFKKGEFPDAHYLDMDIPLILFDENVLYSSTKKLRMLLLEKEKELSILTSGLE